MYPQIERKKGKKKNHSFNNKRIHVSSYEEKIDAKINRNKQGFFWGGGGAFSFIYQRYMYKCTFPDIISLQMIFLEEALPYLLLPLHGLKRRKKGTRIKPERKWPARQTDQQAKSRLEHAGIVETEAEG